MNIFEMLNFQGLGIGLATFLIIGLCHPLVIKGEYYLGARATKWFFGIGGVIFTVMALLTWSPVWGPILGVAAFSFFWGIKEVNEQVQRVAKGWFPANPRRTAVQSENDNTLK